MRLIGDFDELRGLVGQELGTSDWLSVTQDMIDGFAEITGDHQWIHVDVKRAEAESPYGGTIAHGYLTLALLPQMVYRIYSVDGVRQSINYGLDKLRFPAAVRAGARLRTILHLMKVDEVEPDGVRLTNRATMEIEGADKPACVAETVTVFFR
jgi:acyl dehydratase